MVLQRGKPVPVFGIAEAGEHITVLFKGTAKIVVADARGNWQVKFPAMKADAAAKHMRFIGNNETTISNVLVGDVWLCSGQSNMDMSLGSCNRKEDIDSADFPGIRLFRVSNTSAGEPLKALKGELSWKVCTPATAGRFSAAAFYYARKIYEETKGEIPIGLIVSSVGGTPIDMWLVPEGLVDIPVLHPLLSQPVLPGGPFNLANGMIQPVAPYGIRGAIWYQGENAERTVQSSDSYYLKMKALIQGWKRLWGMNDFPFYYVMIANYGELLKTNTPILQSGGWNGDTRIQQAFAMAIPHAGCASAIDIGVSKVSWPGYHPENKLDVGERLAFWALKNEYGHPDLVASGPVLKDVSLAGETVVCSFDHAGSGLMVGAKEWYKPTKEVSGGTLKRFVIAGADGVWYPANAVIKGDTVVMSSPKVPEPRKVSYAVWQNPEGCNLYNREGLPAAPFHIEDVTEKYTIAAKAGEGGNVSPAGTIRLLPRMPALYTITPEPGYAIQDVKVDGKSLGSVPYYTFDPVYTNHTIEATFGKKAPVYSIATIANEGGAIQPSGAVPAAQGGAKTFSIIPKPGLITKSLTVDGIELGPRDSYTFSDVRQNHTIEATFACTISAEAGYGGSISPCGDVSAGYNDRMAFSIRPIKGYRIAGVIVDGKDVGAKNEYIFDKVTTSHTISVKFKDGSGAKGSIPRKDELIFACLGQSLPKVGTTGPWPTAVPRDGELKPIGTPEIVVVAGSKYSRNLYLDGDGYSFKTYSEPITCKGASIIAVARPIRNQGGSGWFSIVDVFYDRLTLGIRSDSGLVCVRRNGPVVDSKTAIPDGQITILSMIVQPDGTYKVYANGIEVISDETKSEMTALVPGVAGGFATSITVGRNAPDSWTTFNGDIGDVFLYRAALTDKEREDVETYIKRKLTGRLN
jgi:sialate O-acetylesterase